MTNVGWDDGLIMLVMAVLSQAWQVFIVVLGVVIAWRWLHRLGGWAAAAAQPHEKTAFDMLNERFARGEIDDQEYEARRQRLSER